MRLSKVAEISTPMTELESRLEASGLFSSLEILVIVSSVHHAGFDDDPELEQAHNILLKIATEEKPQ
jgi:hypothetical protein